METKIIKVTDSPSIFILCTFPLVYSFHTHYLGTAKFKEVSIQKDGFVSESENWVSSPLNANGVNFVPSP